MGKSFRWVTTGREWDGKAGNYLVDGTGRDTISWPDGIIERVGTRSGNRSKA